MTKGFSAKMASGIGNSAGRWRDRSLRVGRTGFLAGLAIAAAPLMAQIAPPVQRIQPPEGAVIDDPNRVFGDDADVFAPLAIVGALGLNGYAGLTTEYSDNVARLREGQPLSSRFTSKDDWIFRPTVGLTFERPIGRNRIFGTASVGRTIYANNSQLNSNRYGLSGGAAIGLGQACSAQLKAAWSRRDTQLGNFEEVVASQQGRTSFGGSVGCSTITGISGTVGYNRSAVNNYSDDPTVDRSFADVRSEIVSGNIGYRVGLRGQVGVSASWAENSYPNQIIGGVTNSNKIRTFAGFASYRVGNTMNVSGSLGRTNLSSSIPGSTDFTGMNWNLALGYAGPRIGANVSTGQGVNGGQGSSANYSIQRYVNFSTTYRANDRLRFAAGYSHSNADFRGNSAIPETEVANSNTNDRFFIGSDYALNRLLRLGLDFNHQRRSSSPEDYSYKVNSLVFSIRGSF